MVCRVCMSCNSALTSMTPGYIICRIISTSAALYIPAHTINNTIRGWYRKIGTASKHALNAYVGFNVKEATVADCMIRMAYASVAQTVIIPIQDLFNMDERNRINTPSTTTGNWTWRLPLDKLDSDLMQRLLQLVKRYNR